MTSSERFTLPVRARGASSVRELAPLLVWPGSRLVIDAGPVREIDAMNVVVVRAAIERFARGRRDRTVEISGPRNATASAFLHAMLGSLPAPQARWVPSARRAGPPGDVLLPAQRIFDDVARKEHYDALEAAESEMASRPVPGTLLLGGYTSMVHNAIKHATARSDVDVICAACVIDSTYQVAALDTAPTVACCADAEAELRRQIARSFADGGHLAGMTLDAGHDRVLHVLSGDATVEYREDVRTSRNHRHLDGYLVALDIHLATSRP